MTVQSLYQRFANEPLLAPNPIGAQAWADYVGLALDQAVASAHPDLLAQVAGTPVSVADVGHALAGAHVVSVSRDGRRAEPVPGPVGRYESGYLAATPFRPVYVVDRGTVFVRPTGGATSLHKINRKFGTIDADHPVSDYPPLIASAAVADVRWRTLALAHDAASLELDADGAGADPSLVAFVKTTAPVLPALNVTGLPALPTPPVAPTLVYPAAPGGAPTVTFPAAPTLAFPAAPAAPAIPALPADYTDNEADPWTWLDDGDPEQVAAAVAAKRVALEKWEADVRATVSLYGAEVQGYSAEVGAQSQEVAAYRAEVEAGVARYQAYSEETRAYVAGVEGQVARVRAYQAEVQAYTSVVQARSAEQEAQIRAWLAEHVEGALARWRVVEDVAREVARAEGADRGRVDAERRARFEARVRELAARREALAAAVAQAAEDRDRALLMCQTNGVVPELIPKGRS